MICIIDINYKIILHIQGLILQNSTYPWILSEIRNLNWNYNDSNELKFNLVKILKN
jgi:hypothetical protein